MGYRFHNLACESSGRWLVGVNESIGPKKKSIATLFDLETQIKVAEFPVSFSFGGNRISIWGSESPIVFSAGWSTTGVAAYDGFTGELLWRNKQVQDVQRVLADTYGRVGVESEKGSFCHLDIRSGELIGRYRGIRAARPIDIDHLAAKTRSSFGVFNIRSAQWLWKTKVDSPYEVASSQSHIAVSEFRLVSIFEVGGNLLTTLSARGESHFVDLSAFERIQVTLSEPNHEHSPVRMWIGSDGKVVKEDAFPLHSDGFGSCYLSSDRLASVDGNIYQFGPFRQVFRLPD